MSKDQDKTPELKTFNTDVLVPESTALSKGIAGLIPMTKTKKGWNDVLANQHASDLLTATMTTFISVDMRFDVGMKSMGEILTNLLKQGPEIHRRAIEVICAAQGIPTIEYSEKAPLKSFALALFAKFPEMASNVKGGKDTKGSLRLSSYIYAYKQATRKQITSGSGTGSRDTAGNNSNPRSAVDLFLMLWEVATAKDKKTLESLSKRAKVAYEKWLPKEDEEKGEE